MWRMFAILSAVWVTTEGVRMYPCGKAGYQDVVENTLITLYCDQYTGSVDWKFKPPNGIPVTLSTCPVPGSTPICSTPINYLWTVALISATNSSLTTSWTGRTNVQSGVEYQCVSGGNKETCGLNVIVPAVVSQPTTPDITRQHSGYTVSISADITQVYSSRGIYSCVWQLGTDRKTPALDLDPPASNTNNTTDRSGNCVVTMPLPSNTGDHSCSVMVSPGNTHKSCDTITITRPPPPTISCPTDVIAENTSLNCTCNTNNIGQPGGRLRWYNGSGNDVTTKVISGNYDVNSLSMTWMVSRHDHNKTFLCINNWTVNIPGHNYTAQVAWGPDAVSIQGNTTLYTNSSGSKSLTLTCNVSQVNPTSALTYSWNIPCDAQNQSTCTFKPCPPGPGDSGDVNRTITCTVTNVKNNNKEQQGSVTLDLKYPPRSAPQISSFSNTSALHPNGSLTLTCTVTEGYPEVTSVTLTCPGRHEQNTTSGQLSNLVISPVTAADHNLNCVCRGHWVKESYYTLTASRTLIVYYAATNTSLNVNNNVTVTLNESEALTLLCQSRGVPAPDLQLLQRDVTLARQDGGSLPEEWNQLNHSAAASCNNTGTVTCRASNEVGEVGDGQHPSVQLYVYCKPRISAAEPDPPAVNFVTTPVTVPFHLEAFPLPDVFSFRYLGSSQSSSSNQPVPDNIELSVTCNNTFAKYAVLCNVTVQSVQNSSAEGFYTFTAGNAFGEERLVFQVKVNTSDTEIGELDGLLLGAGLGTGLAVLVIVLIIAVCCVCRRKNNDEQYGNTDVGVTGHASEPPHASHKSEEYGSLNTDDIGLKSLHCDVKQAQTSQDADDNQYENTKFGATGHTPEPSAASTNSDTGDYGSLNTDDIGLKSVYCDLKQAQTSQAADTGDYGSLNTDDIELKSVYCDLKQAQTSQAAGVDNEIPVPQRPFARFGKK